MGRGRNQNKCLKKHKPKEGHKNKYDNKGLGNKEKSKLISMLGELKQVKDITSNENYLALNGMDKGTSGYYQAVKSLYYSYVNQSS